MFWGAKSDRKRNFENGVVTDDPALIAPLEDQFDAARGALTPFAVLGLVCRYGVRPMIEDCRKGVGIQM